MCRSSTSVRVASAAWPARLAQTSLDVAGEFVSSQPSFHHPCRDCFVSALAPYALLTRVSSPEGGHLPGLAAEMVQHWSGYS